MTHSTPRRTRMCAAVLAGLALAVMAGAALANGGGIILTPPPEFTLIAPGSVEHLLPGVHVKHAVEEDGAIWAATLDRGLAVRARGARDFAFLDRKSGRVPADALARVARVGEKTWIGFPSGGVARLDEEGFTTFGAPEGLPGDEVVDLAVQGDTLWALTSAGLFGLEGSRFVPVPMGGDRPRGLVTAVCAGYDGKLYVGTDQTDVGVWDGKAWKRYAFANRVVGRVIRCVAAGTGHIWFGTFGSLSDYTPETDRLDDETVEKAVLFPSHIMVSLAGNEQLMMTATSGGGLYRFDRPASWRLYTDTNGLPSISIESVTLKHPFTLVATANGLARIDLSRPLPMVEKAAARPAAGAPLAGPTVSTTARAATVGAQTTAPALLTPAHSADALRSLPEARSGLASTGRALLDVPSLLGSRGFTCLTCHAGMHGNPAYTSPTGPAGTVDLTNRYTAPSAEDLVANPRKIPHLFGLRYRAPFPSAGWAPSLREYLRAHIVRDFEAAEPSPAALDALEVYLLNVEPPEPPGLKPDGQLRIHVGGAARRGEALFRREFETLGRKSCASCHEPAHHFTDNQLHARVNGSHVRTPTLLSLARSAPYFADGSRRTLTDVAAYYNDTYHLLLKRGDVEDLAAYLATVGEVSAP